MRRATARAGPIVLVHVPRTGGTTLAMLLRHHYRDGRFVGGGNVFARGEILEARLRDIATRKKLGAVAGHLPFGLRDLLPADAVFVTLLREPVERTLSHYFVLPQSNPARNRGLVPPWLPQAAPDVTLEEALAPGGYILDNLQTRMLSDLTSPYDDLPPDALEQAKRNLRERFAYVGTTERFDEFLALLNLELGWPTRAVKRSRARAPKPGQRHVPGEALRLVVERNELDLELYHYAASLLETAVEAAGPDFATELEVLRTATQRWNERDLPGADEIRSFGFDARVALAIQEAELARTATQVRRLAKRQRAESRRERAQQLAAEERL